MFYTEVVNLIVLVQQGGWVYFLRWMIEDEVNNSYDKMIRV